MAKIPVRGINPALKKATANLTKKAQVDDAVKGIRRAMSQTAESAKPVQQFIDDTLSINVPRRANGRRIKKSAKESANVFVTNIDDVKFYETISDDAIKRTITANNTDDVIFNEIFANDAIKRTRIVNENRKRSSELRKKFSNGIVDENRKRSSELRKKFSNRTANNTDEAFRNGEISARRQQLKDNTRDLSDRGSRLEERQNIKNSPNGPFVRRQEAQNAKTANTNATQAERARNLGGTSPNSNSSQRADLSGSSPEQYSTRELKSNRYNDKESYMKYSVANQYDDAIRSWERGDYNNPILESLKSDGMDLKNATKDDLFSKRSDAIKNASGNDMGFGDWMGYTKAPQYATAIGGTAWLVSRMSSTKGQQTNSQLYGQSPY